MQRISCLSAQKVNRSPVHAQKRDLGLIPQKSLFSKTPPYILNSNPKKTGLENRKADQLVPFLEQREILNDKYSLITRNNGMEALFIFLLSSKHSTRFKTAH